MDLDLILQIASQGLEPIPAGTICVLVMKIKPGNCGIDGLCKRSSKGDSEGLDVEYVVQGDKYDKRKIYAFHLLDGVTSGHAKAGEITRSLLRAIYEAVHGIDPNDNSPDGNLASGQCFACRLQRRDVPGRTRDRARRPEAGRRLRGRTRTSSARFCVRVMQVPQARPAAAGADRTFGTAHHTESTSQWFASGRTDRDRKADLGGVIMARHKIGTPTPEDSIDDMWQRRATAAAIVAVRELIMPAGPFRRRRRSRGSAISSLAG